MFLHQFSTHVENYETDWGCNAPTFTSELVQIKIIT